MSSDFKPYIFWIVCGVLFVAELAAAWFWQPKVLDGNKAYNAHRVARDFNKGYGTFKTTYAERSKNTVALGGNPTPELIDPTDDKSVQDALKKYIVGKDWVTELEEKRATYQRVERDIKAYLYRSSEPINQVVSTKTDGPFWYTDYNQEVVRLLEELSAAQVIAVPPKVKEMTADERERWFGKDAGALRTSLSLFTTENEWPEPARRPILSKQFYIVQVLARTLATAKGELRADPYLTQKVIEAGEKQDDKPAPDQEKQDEEQQDEEQQDEEQQDEEKRDEKKQDEEYIVQVPKPEPGDGLERIWIVQLAVSDKMVDGSGDPVSPRCWTAELTLQGSSAAIMAALQQIDEMNSPIVVRLGATWEALLPAQRDRQDVKRKDVPFRVVVPLVICDFGHFPPPVPEPPGE